MAIKKYNLLTLLVPNWRITKPVVLISCLIAVGILGITDYITGFEISFSIFYLLPISVATIFAGLTAGLVVSLVSACTWLAADLAYGHAYSQIVIPYWNTIVRLGYFCLHSVLLSAFFSKQKKLAHIIAEMAEKNRQLKELDQLKSDFVAIVSHELRTPLTSIIGFAKTLLRIRLPEEKQKECLTLIEKEGNNLAALIEDYLDVSKIETGNFSLIKTATNITNLMTAITKTIDHKERVTIIFDDTIPDIDIDIDAYRITRVVRNIIENAFKHGGPNVLICLEVKKQQNSVMISISDNGRGIPSNQKEKIFDKFYRGISKSTGSGLGLAIAKAIIEEHGGCIWCDSEPGKGAAFHFTIPILQQSRTN